MIAPFRSWADTSGGAAQICAQSPGSGVDIDS
jgi:hypothetical protein